MRLLGAASCFGRKDIGMQGHRQPRTQVFQGQGGTPGTHCLHYVLINYYIKIC